LLVKASVVVLTTALALAVVGRRASAASRHLLCALAIAGLLALPILSGLLPGWAPVQLKGFLADADQSTIEQDRRPPASLPFIDVAGPANRLRAEGASASLAGALAEAEAGHYATTKTGHYVHTPMPVVATFMALVSSRMLWVLLYTSGVLLFIVRLIIDRFAVRRLVRHASELREP
jgi:hypothetical protein